MYFPLAGTPCIALGESGTEREMTWKGGREGGKEVGIGIGRLETYIDVKSIFLV